MVTYKSTGYKPTTATPRRPSPVPEERVRPTTVQAMDVIVRAIKDAQRTQGYAVKKANCSMVWAYADWFCNAIMGLEGNDAHYCFYRFSRGVGCA